MKSKTVYVLGAGASKDAGAPLLSDFSDWNYLNKIIPELKKSNINTDKFVEIGTNINYFINNRYVSNIEELLNFTYTAEYIDIRFYNPSVKDGIFPEIFRQDLEWFITAVLSASVKRKKDYFYNKFITEKLNPNDSLISFNYDLIFEDVVHKTDFDINYGFDDGWKPEPNKKELLLLKLHGSVDWLWCDYCGLTIDYNKNVALDIQENKSVCLGCKRNKGLSPVIIPPIFNKEQYLVRMKKSKRNLRDVWLRAFDELSSSNKIVFIGYSLPIPDSYAQALIKMAISVNKNKPEIEIINPDINSFKRYSDVLNCKKIHPKSISFKEYVNGSD